MSCRLLTRNERERYENNPIARCVLRWGQRFIECNDIVFSGGGGGGAIKILFGGSSRDKKNRNETHRNVNIVLKRPSSFSNYDSRVPLESISPIARRYRSPLYILCQWTTCELMNCKCRLFVRRKFTVRNKNSVAFACSCSSLISTDRTRWPRMTFEIFYLRHRVTIVSGHLIVSNAILSINIVWLRYAIRHICSIRLRPRKRNKSRNRTVIGMNKNENFLCFWCVVMSC